MPEQLTPDQFAQIHKLDMQHPTTWVRGTWYPADLNGLAVQIMRTRSRGIPYLKVRKPITINLKDTRGNIINSRKGWDTFTVNLKLGTVSYLGW